MRLTTKFFILVAFIGLAVGVSLGFAAWSVFTLDRELTRSYASLTIVLERIDAMKRAFEKGLELLESVEDAAGDSEAASSARSSAEEIAGQLGNIELHIKSLAAIDELPERAGAGAAQSILTRARVVFDDLREAFTYLSRRGNQEEAGVEIQRDVAARTRADFRTLHNLIERVEGQLLSDVAYSVEHGSAIKSLLVRVLIFCGVLSLLTALLALMLVRRWVLLPVQDVRTAAAQISRGRYDYRIPVRGTDEIGALAGEVNQMASTIVDIQRQLVERERMAAVGELTRRIAHNLRNPLAGIRNLAELTRGDLPAQSDLAENQTRIVVAVDRFEAWLSELLYSTRPLELHSEWHAPGQILQHVVDSHRPLAQARGIRIELDISQAPPRVFVDAANLEHAVVSLVSNALEAAPPGGMVRIAARSTQVGKDEDRPRDSDQAASTATPWEVRVEDSGPGVDPGATDRIFLPHFTTKKHGTGTGLAIVHNVVTAHRGRIRVERSELGGAAFVMSLPC